MAEVYRRFQGKSFEKGLAMFTPVQAMTSYAAHGIAAKAKGNLANHRHDGHSFIETVKHGDIDYYVVLNDTRGQAAAMSIEFGRGPNDDGKGQTRGTRVLHDAAGINIERTFPRSRRRKDYYE